MHDSILNRSLAGLSLVPSPSHPSFYLATMEIKAGVGRTGNEASRPYSAVCTLRYLVCILC